MSHVLKNTNIEKAIILALLAYAAFSLSDGLRKILVQDHEVIDILFWQAICGIFIIIAITPFMGGFKSLIDFPNIKWHLVRGVLIALNTTFSLQAISRIPIMDAYMIFFLTPFVISILGAIVFKETIGKYRGFSIIAGFVGAFIAFRPGFEEINPAYLLALVCVFTFSTSSILARYIGNKNGLLPFAFWPFLCLIVGIFIYKGGYVAPVNDLGFYGYMVIMGAAYGGAMLMISYSFNLAPAVVIAPYQYIQIVFALGFDYFLWSSVPDGPKIIGALIIIGAGIFLVSCERAKNSKTQQE